LKNPKAFFGWPEVMPASDFHPRFNIAPSQRVPVVTGAGRPDVDFKSLACYESLRIQRETSLSDSRG
jgi:hypothetical protein